MPFDPTKPAPNSPITSAELRNQFTGLKDLIDAIPPAPPETDPVFEASEAHLFVPGDKAKLDSLTPGGSGSYSSRIVAFDTVYTPSATKDVIVIARLAFNSSAGDAVSIVAWSDNQADPATEVARAGLTAATASVYCEQTLMFVCAKGQKYKFTLGVQGGATGGFAGPVMEFAL